MEHTNLIKKTVVYMTPTIAQVESVSSIRPKTLLIVACQTGRGICRPEGGAVEF